jgi:hypothetical protein
MGHSWYNSGTEKWNGEIYLRWTRFEINGVTNDKYKLHALEGDYAIVDDRLVWANPNIYLQNNNKNYIDTEYVPKSNTAIILDFRVDNVRDISSSTRNWICGGEALYAKPGNFYGGFWFQGTTIGSSRFWLNTTSAGAGYSGNITNEEFVLHKYRLILVSPYNINYRNPNNNGSISQIIQLDNNIVIRSTGALETNWGVLSQSVVLFNRKASINSASNYLLGEIYTTEIWEDNNLIKKLVPVPTGLQIGDFTVPSNGMFDIVNQQFYPNQGTGTFTYGKDE